MYTCPPQMAPRLHREMSLSESCPENEVPPPRRTLWAPSPPLPKPSLL